MVHEFSNVLILFFSMWEYLSQHKLSIYVPICLHVWPISYLLILRFAFKHPLHDFAPAPIVTNLLKVYIVLIMYKCFLPGHTILSMLHLSTSFYSNHPSISSFPCCKVALSFYTQLCMIFFGLFASWVCLQMSSLLGPPQPWQGCVLDYSNIAASVCFLLVGFYITCVFFFSLPFLTYVQDFLSMIERLPDFHSLFVGNFCSTLVAKQLKLDVSGLKLSMKLGHFLRVSLLTSLAELVALLLVQSEGRRLFLFSQHI